MQALVRRFITRCLRARMVAHRNWAALQIQRIWQGMLGRNKAIDVRNRRLAGASGRAGIAFIVKLKVSTISISTLANLSIRSMNIFKHRAISVACTLQRVIC
jgi:hypothetical protein